MSIDPEILLGLHNSRQNQSSIELQRQILDMQKLLASLGEKAMKAIPQALRKSKGENLPRPDVYDMMEVLKFGVVECNLSHAQGDKLMRLLNHYTEKHEAKVRCLPERWKTMEECLESCTSDMSFVKKYVRPLDKKYFGKYEIGTTDVLLKPIVGFMMNLKIIVGKCF
jgi:hypothetical protein